MMVPPAIHSAMQSAVEDGVFPGAVLAVRVRSKLQFIEVSGRLSSGATSPPVQASTLYDLASLTKPLVTVTSVLLLVQRAKVRLDDPIQHILAELTGTAVGQATMQDLLTHSSGLPGWRPLYERLAAKGMSPDRVEPASVRQAVLRLIREEPMVYPRGARSLYSDLGFILLGLIVERLTGMMLDRWYRETVTGPLRAAPLLFSPIAAATSGAQAPGIDPVAIAPTEYDSWRNRMLQGEVHDENAAALGGIAGHAGLFGTAEAVLALSGAWLQAHHGEPSILDPGLVRRFAARQQEIPQSSWALGWDTPTAPSSSGAFFSASSFGHLGYTGTSLWVDPVRDLEVALLSNRVHPSRRNEKIREFRPRIHDLVVQECAPAR
ncbi:MAG: serine hydrolase [Nitrospira sp. CR1.3]|nr:serine hydrolase [Nitrospira sp. CR1.3]